MRIGRFPGQEEVIQDFLAHAKEVGREEGRRQGSAVANRRMFLGLVVGGVIGGGCGSLATRARSAPAEDEARKATPPRAGTTSRDVALAHALASGPLADLVDKRDVFLRLVNQANDPDEVMWFGVSRLASAALEETAENHDRLGRTLLAFSQVKRGAPPHVQLWFDAIQKRRR